MEVKLEKKITTFSMMEYAIKIVRFKQKKSLYTDVKDKASRSCLFFRNIHNLFSQLYEENNMSTFTLPIGRRCLADAG